MANSSEFLSNEYMVFEADQVLTNYHLNQLFYYLDQQNRWTRNKLIGIGIVCGLDIVQHTDTNLVEITAGCGITSQGYLILQEDAKQYTSYIAYPGVDQPNDLPFTYNGSLPFFKPYNSDKSVFLLLTDDDFNALEADSQSQAQKLSSAITSKLFDEYVITLFLEAGEVDLKNCDVFDCNNKGEKMAFNVRPLLVKKTELPTQQTDQPNLQIRFPNIISTRNLTSTSAILSTAVKPTMAGSFATLSTSAISAATASTIASPPVPTITTSINPIFNIPISPLPPLLFLKPPEINLKRFNVPYTDLRTTDNIIDAFTKLTDDITLSSVADAYNYCYLKYKDILDVTDNPFTNLFANLKSLRDQVMQSFPLYIQYFYDFIDDLSKAYYEFREKASLLLSSCCPDENLFPLHLVLGSSTATTKDFTRDFYRTYFTYSPLFARQENEISESAFLFRRMQIMINEFSVALPSDLNQAVIRINPGLYEQSYLSQRVIPYYYMLNESGSELYKYWNYYKTIRDNAESNLSYNSNLYSSDTAVLDPLSYDIEKYNFFRIEGHLGTNYQMALTSILQQRQNYNLPFDVVAISADQLPTDGNALPQCNILDLDTNYDLIVNELSCKVHTAFCFIASLTDPTLNLNGPVFSIGGPTISPLAAVAPGAIASAGLASSATIPAGVVADSASTASSGATASDTIAGAGSAIPASSILPFGTFRLQNPNLTTINLPVLQTTYVYQKGDYMKMYCAPSANTIGSSYLNSISSGIFRNPLQVLSSSSTNLIHYSYFFEYIDAVESLMQVLVTATIATLDMQVFTAAYKRFSDALNAIIFSVTQAMSDQLSNTDDSQFFKDIEMDIFVEEVTISIYSCIDERIQTLKDEYQYRLQLYQLQLGFYNYYNKHYGLEHKAGVPKGGTFVLVYHPPAVPVQTLPTTIGTVSLPTSATGVITTGQFTNPNVPGLSGITPFTGITSFTPIQPAIAAQPAVAVTPQPAVSLSPAAAFGVQSAPATIQASALGLQPGISTFQQPAAVQQPVPIKLQQSSFGVAQQPAFGTRTAASGFQTIGAIQQPTSGVLFNPITTIPVFTPVQPVTPPITITIPPSTGISQPPLTTPPIFTPPIFQPPVNSTGLLDVNTIDFFKNLATNATDVTEQNKQTILDFLSRGQTQTTGSKYTLASNIVIADFYVPYLCCSDCAPVAYIVTQLVVAAEFSIAPNEFLFDDPKDYPFVAKPPVTNANKGQTPFTSLDILNPGNLNLFTDDANVFYLHPAMPELEQTLVTTITYKHVPQLITIIKPDASFTINEIRDAKSNKMLQFIPADVNADTYTWKINDKEGIIENKSNPAAISVKDLMDKTGTSSFDISLTVSYKRNDTTSEDTKTQTYEVSTVICIDFEEPTFKLNTVYGPQVGQKEGDVIFTTIDNIVAKIFPINFGEGNSLGIAMIQQVPEIFNKSQQCLSVSNITIQFDYSNLDQLPSQVTVDFFDQGGTENLSVNDSDPFIGDLSEPPAELGGVTISVVMGTGDNSGTGTLTLTGTDKAPIKTFSIAGQEFFIDNVCSK
jgi:hypothetical protein